MWKSTTPGTVISYEPEAMNNSPDNLARTVLTDPVHILAFGFGTGLAPFAPGTFGSIPGVIIFWLTLDLGLYVQLGIAGAMALAGIWICGESARRIGDNDLIVVLDRF